MRDADTAVVRAADAVRAMMRAVREAGGLASALHERLALALTYLVAPTRARATTEAWEAYHAVVAGDVPNMDWPATGGMSAEEVTHARTELADTLAQLAIAVGSECEGLRCQWLAAAQREVARREEREANRGWMRVCMRSWREAADGLPAGAAAFDQRWERGSDCALAQRLHISGPALRQWGEREWLAVKRVLTWQRLVRAGDVRRMRRRNHAWHAAREVEHRRLWYSALPHTQGHDTHGRDEQVARWRHSRERQHASGRVQRASVRSDASDACSGGDSGGGASSGTARGGRDGPGEDGAHAAVPSDSDGDTSCTSASDGDQNLSFRPETAARAVSVPGGPSRGPGPRQARTRRTDHVLALTAVARALLRCHLAGGGGTRLAHARRPRGDG